MARERGEIVKRTLAALLLVGILAGCSGVAPTVAVPTATPAAADFCAIEFGVGADAMTVVYTHETANSADCADDVWRGQAEPGGARAVTLPSGPPVCEWRPGGAIYADGEMVYGGAAAARACALDAAANATP